MVIMTLDHCRDYFHLGALESDPTDMQTTTPVIFFTRFITHFCAPAFVFLAGTSAFLFGTKTTKSNLFKFLITRGLWLLFIEIFVMNLIWWFDLSFGYINLQVIWAIGISMIALGLLIYLPQKVILALGFILIAGHNLLDGFVMEGNSLSSVIWYVLHQPNYNISIAPNLMIGIVYPVLPWIGVMALGYCFGNLYSSNFDSCIRKKWLLRFGLGTIAIFFILRGINVYGDLTPWAFQKNGLYSVLSFFNVTKYPPSFDFILITTGPAFLFLYAFETAKNKITDFFIVFGRVPFFYYILHIFLIHLLALLGLIITGGDWHTMILTNDKFESNILLHYGYSLGVTYAAWIVVVPLLYPLCKKYMHYKANHKDKWWLSYL